jgi:hypothetical protein
VDSVLCKICGKRRARRACPAVHGDICSICCGTEREVSLACPLECEFLREAHRHEKPLPVDGELRADADVAVSEDFLREQEELLLFSIFSLVEAALRTAGAVDGDVLDALAALIQTRRTAQSGLVYETRASNTIGAQVQRAFTESLADYQKVRVERESLAPVRDSDLLKILVFLRRMGLQNHNGRPRGRMFIDLLHQMTPPSAAPKAPVSSIIL